MDLGEPKPTEVYRVFDRESGRLAGAYSRACHTEIDFRSVEHARGAMCDDSFQDKQRYRVAKYRVVYELIDPDVDGRGEPPEEITPRGLMGLLARQAFKEIEDEQREKHGGSE